MPAQDTLRFIGLSLLWSRRKWIFQADSDKVEHARYCSWPKKGPEAPIREGLPGTASPQGVWCSWKDDKDVRKAEVGNDSGRPWWGCADSGFGCWEREQMGDRQGKGLWVRQAAWKGLYGPALSFESFALSK